MKLWKSWLASVFMGIKPEFNNTSPIVRQEFCFTRSEILKFFTLCHSMCKKSSPLTFGCINKNELNGPGSGISIMGGLYSQLLYVHTDGILYWTSSQRGWQPHPIHGQPDGVLYWASSQILFFFACFFIPSIKRIGSW
jgi:hypothetical protein